MKHIPTIAAALLGVAFIFFGLNHFAGWISPGGGGKPAPEVIHFFQAVKPSGFMDFVKVCEILGGLLVLLPKTRNIGLLVLGPIVINILAFNIFIAGGGAVFQPPVIVISVLSAYLLWIGREKFAGLLN
jgi:uncharacterized membrane protein YphA (DoxX/SURF4 family)